MGKFRSNIIPRGRMITDEEIIKKVERNTIKRAILASDYARSKSVKVSLPKFSWEENK